MAEVRDILADPVTAHMRTDVTRLTAGQTIGEVLEYLRKEPPAARVLDLYVVDADAPALALAAGPMAPAMSDMLALLLCFNLGRWLLA